MSDPCTHLDMIKPVTPSARGLRGVPENGRRLGASAPLPHVRARRLLRLLALQARDQAFHRTKHPIIQSLEPGEDWKWCYVDEVLIP